MAGLFFFFFSLFLLSPVPGLSQQLHTTNKPKTYSVPIHYRSDTSNILARDRLRKKSIFKILSGGEFDLRPTSTEILARVGVGIGEDIQTVTLTVDPGSYLTWWQCNCNLPWSHCYPQDGPEDEFFNRAKSSSYKKVYCGENECLVDPIRSCAYDRENPQDKRLLCRYQESYADGSSVQGTISKEVMNLLSDDMGSFEVNVAFGCGEFQIPDNLFPPQASGLMGLANHPFSLFRQINTTVFTICLPSRLAWSSGGPSGGLPTPTITFHENWSPPESSNITTTNMIEKEKNAAGYYYVDIQQIDVGSTKIDVSPSTYTDAIVDFGSTYTALPYEAYEKLKTVFEQQVREKNPALKSVTVAGQDVCFETKMEQINKLIIPMVRITFGPPGSGAVFETSYPDQILRPIDENVACLAFSAEEKFTVLGNVLFQRIRTHFDVSAKKITFQYNAYKRSEA